MITRLLDFKTTQIILTLGIIAGVVFCIYTPNYYLFKLGSQFAGIIMLAYLALGLFFMAFRQTGLMLSAFICCGGLCFFLKNSSNSDLKYASATTENVIKVAHFNISDSSPDPEETVNSILNSDADFISIQDITPDWQYILDEAMEEKYPYSKSVLRFDPYGLAIYSQYPFTAVDTFQASNIPNIKGEIDLLGKRFRMSFIAAHTTPPLYSQAYSVMQNQIEKIALNAKSEAEPMLLLGNFNAPPWWGEIKNLRTTANLKDSRRSASSGFKDMFQSPSDYIFHSDHLKCVGFENLYNDNLQSIGIVGTYQFNPRPKYESSLLQ